MIQHINEIPSDPQRVVILGGSGFLGRRLNADLESQGIPTLSLSSKDLDLTTTDSVVQLAEIIQSEDTVVFASCLTPDKGKDIATTMNNLLMGQHVAAAVEQSPCRHLIYISSDAVYADDVTLADETAKAEPSGLYGMGHLMRERLMEFAANSAGIPLLILRPSILYGAEDTHNSYGPNRFRRTALANDKIELFGDGEETRDHVYVEDAVALIELGIKHQSQGILNIATGASPSFHEVATLLVERIEQPVEIVCHPRSNPITHRHYDVTATLKAFPGFRFTSLREGLTKTLHLAAQLEESLAAA